MRNAGQLYAEFTEYRAEKLGSNKRNISSDLLKRGPLYQFLQAVTEIKGNKRKVPLHMINIRDWHQPSAQFDEERRRYGMHCEAGSWSALPLDGFEKFLSPWDKTTEAEEAALSPQGYEENGIHYYDIRSDSVFDFYPTYQGKKVIPSQLEQVLNRIITPDENQRVILLLIGVYTDIKVRILLTNLRSRYPVDNLIVSDVLTAAPSLERHLSGLDFAVKVLNVEVIHSLNDLVQLVNPQHKEHAIPQSITQNSVNFRDYQTYFLDKQNLLAYQEQKQIQYLELTKRRAARVYHVIFVTSRNMMRLGLAFVFIAALAAGWAVLDPDRATSPYLTTTGFLGVAGIVQLMLVMYRNPIQELQKNLNNLVRLQTTLETQSLILALTRYHVSRPERLYPKDPQREKEELANLQEQINIITKASEVTSKQLAQVGDTFETVTSNGNAGIPSSSEDMPAN
jgi:nicotinamidase-related amidase